MVAARRASAAANHRLVLNVSYNHDSPWTPPGRWVIRAKSRREARWSRSSPRRPRATASSKASRSRWPSRSREGRLGGIAGGKAAPFAPQPSKDPARSCRAPRPALSVATFAIDPAAWCGGLPWHEPTPRPCRIDAWLDRGDARRCGPCAGETYACCTASHRMDSTLRRMGARQGELVEEARGRREGAAHALCSVDLRSAESRGRATLRDREVRRTAKSMRRHLQSAAFDPAPKASPSSRRGHGVGIRACACPVVRRSLLADRHGPAKPRRNRTHVRMESAVAGHSRRAPGAYQQAVLRRDLAGIDAYRCVTLMSRRRARLCRGGGA